MCSDNRSESWQAPECASVPPLTDATPTAELTPHGPLIANTSLVPQAPTRGCILRSRYVLEEIIGRGGTSIVFRATDLIRGHGVAVKLLCAERRTDPVTLRRLQREFLQMQSLSHPGTVRVFDFDCDGDVWFISMELVACPTVKSWIATPHSYPQALKLVASCCSALEHAHSVGVLHGDLKPTNVMVAKDGTARLIDFGSASSLGAAVAAGSDLTLPATPSYASPDILAGRRVEQRDDIYSLACLAYNILSGGWHPFGGRPSFEHGRAKCAPTYVRAIPPEVFRVIERCLSAEREHRAASAGEFLRDLLDADRQEHRAAGARHQPVAIPSGVKHVAGWASGHRFSLANALAAALAVVGAVSLQLDRQRALINDAELPSKATAQQAFLDR